MLVAEAAYETEREHRHAPHAVDERSSAAGLRAVAMLEGIKGSAVVVLMFVVLAIHRHAEIIAEHMLFHLHIDLDRHLAHQILHGAQKLTDTRLLTIVLAAIVYCSGRYIEAWGLWHRRVWAEWFALLSGGMYLPWEVLKLIQHPSWIHWLLILTNVVIIVYMAKVRICSLRPAKCKKPTAVHEHITVPAQFSGR